MLYKIIHNNKTLDIIEFPNQLSNRQFKKGLKSIHKRLFKQKVNYIKYEKLNQKDAYLVLDKSGKMLYELHRHIPLWKRIFGFLLEI